MKHWIAWLVDWLERKANPRIKDTIPLFVANDGVWHQAEHVYKIGHGLIVATVCGLVIAANTGTLVNARRLPTCGMCLDWRRRHH